MSISTGSHLRICDNDKLDYHELLNRTKYLERLEVESREQRRRLVELVAKMQAEIDRLLQRLKELDVLT